MTPDDFKFACGVLDDHRRLISAGKSQRWDVVKWAVALNAALAAAAIAFEDSAFAKGVIWISCLVAFIGGLLVFYYNIRITRTRNESVITEKYLVANKIDYRAITGRTPEKATWLYDREELLVFALVLILSVLPSILVYGVRL